jgi:hypothetical protein
LPSYLKLLKFTFYYRAYYPRFFDDIEFAFNVHCDYFGKL